MKNLKIRLGLFSLLAVLAVSVFLTACEQEIITPDVTQNTDIQNTETASFKINVPNGLTGNEAIEWAKTQPEDHFVEITKAEAENLIESRWCQEWLVNSSYESDVCYCDCSNYPDFYDAWDKCCSRRCNIYHRYCGGWSGGQYVVTFSIITRCNC